MKVKILIAIICVLPIICWGQKINNDLEITKITDNVYEHISYETIGKWGRVASNGLIIINKGKALMIDTPMDVKQTKNLISFIKDSLQAEVVLFVPGHFHDDCVGGMNYLQSLGVKTCAHKMTNELLALNKKTVAEQSFEGYKVLRLGNKRIECYFLGGGHSKDNIVVWIPDEKVLFGGCMVKDCSATDIGNLSDAAPFKEWISTINKIENKFPHAKYIIPGHGAYGGKELLEHTKELILNQPEFKK